MIDAQIVTRLKNRDKSALSDLYEYYGAAFYGHALHILESESLAQEAIQDTFLKVWNNISEYDDSKGKLFTWMYRIARNEAIHRKGSKEIRHPDKPNSIESNVNKYEADTTKNDIGVKQLLNLLDDDTKGIFEMVYFKGYTHAEVADLTKTSLDTVKCKVRSAVLKLRSFLIKE